MTSSADLAIRLRRAAFNHALAEGDLAAIGPILTPNSVLVTGTDSAVISGRKAQLAAWKSEFTARERIVYVRTPERIEVSGIEPIALEHGRWAGTSALTGQAVASGSYTAKWRHIGQDWAIEAEIFLTLA